MSEDLRAALRSWKETDNKARAAENKLRQARADFQAHRLSAVPESLVQTVAELRREANEKLKITLKLLKPDHPSDN